MPSMSFDLTHHLLAFHLCITGNVIPDYLESNVKWDVTRFVLKEVSVSRKISLMMDDAIPSYSQRSKGKGCDNCYSALLYLRHSHENKLLNGTEGERLIKIAI